MLIVENRAALIVLSILAVAAFCGSVTAGVVKVTKEEEKAWLYYTLPLPHRISISGKVMVSPADMAVSLCANAGPVERNAAAILRESVRKGTGVAPAGKGFQIVMGVVDAEGKVGGVSLANAGKLKGFPNNDQAYVIEPVGETKLVIGALDPKGVFYGMHTLRQLLAREMSREQIAVPLAQVEDWPDFANRGLWNSCLTIYPELSMVKLNYMKNYGSGSMLAVQPPPRADGQPAPLWTWGTKTLPKTAHLYKDGQRYAFHNIPNMTHINFWPHKKGEVFRMYPELGGHGDTAVLPGGRHRMPCPSHPMLRKIIADTLTLHAKAGIMEVSVWTSEYYGYCSCPKCIPPGGKPRQFILEARAIVGAWRDVKKKYPDFKVRLFGIPLKRFGIIPAAGKTAKAAWNREMPVIMAELPKDVVLESVYTLYRSRAGKRYVRVLDDYAAKGYRIMEYTIGPGLLYNNFFALPQLRRNVINRFEAKWYGGLRWSMFSVDHDLTLRFLSHEIDALAEWTWNTKGRSVPEFVKAWATVTGINQPDAVVEWAKYAVNRKGPYTFDFGTVSKQWLKKMVNQIKAGKSLSLVRGIPPIDYSAVFQDLAKMRELAGAINEEFIIRTEYLTALYKEMKALKDFTDQYNDKMSADRMLEATKTLEQAIAERVRAFDALIAIFGKLPNRYKRSRPDFAAQRKIMSDELLPLMSKRRP